MLDPIEEASSKNSTPPRERQKDVMTERTVGVLIKE
jgi:hypothetical protein